MFMLADARFAMQVAPLVGDYRLVAAHEHDLVAALHRASPTEVRGAPLLSSGARRPAAP
ncbi:MAG: hypothetical protein H7226_01295 [Salinibacterium sp.]|nr:hypothetical protein [Salinibacterium sp.]